MNRMGKIANKYAEEILDTMQYLAGEYSTQIIDNRYVAITSNVDGLFDTGVYMVAVKDLRTGRDTGGCYAVDEWKPKFEYENGDLVLVDTILRTKVEFV